MHLLCTFDAPRVHTKNTRSTLGALGYGREGKRSRDRGRENKSLKNRVGK